MAQRQYDGPSESGLEPVFICNDNGDGSFTAVGGTNPIPVASGKGLVLDAWGRQKVVMDESLDHGMFTFEVPQEYWYEQINDVEQTSFTYATSVDGELNLTSNGVLNDKVGLRTFRHPRYQPNRGHLFSGSFFFDNPERAGERTIGVFTKEAGLGFRLRGDGATWALYGVSRTTVGGVTSDTETDLTADLPAGFNPAKGNIYDIQAQMRMVGNFNFCVGAQESGVVECIKTVKNLNMLDKLSVFNPAMPMAFECINQGADVTIRCGCVDLSSEGGSRPKAFYGSISIDNQAGEVAISGFNVPVLAVRVTKLAPNGRLNTRDVIALVATAYADQRAFFRVWATRDETALTLNDQSWRPFRDGQIEFIQYDNPDVTTPMTFDTAKAELIFGARVNQDETYESSALFQDRSDVYQTAGDIFIFTMHRETGLAANVGVTYEIGEEI